MRLEVSKDAADRFALAHAVRANFGTFRQEQLAGGTALLVFLVGFQPRLFFRCFDCLARFVLLAAASFLDLLLETL